MLKHLLLFIAIFTCVYGRCQVSLTSFGTAYTQNFNTLNTSASVNWVNNSTIPNWYASCKKKSLGTIEADNGSISNVGFYNFGSAASTDRAIGAISASSHGDYAYGLRMKNNTGSTIRAFMVTYTGEQWRNSRAVSQNLGFSYQVSNSAITSVSSASGTWTVIDPLKFTSPVTGGTPNALDGNNAANRYTVSYLLTGLSVPNGAEIMFRWLDINHSKLDHALAIDDVTITPTYITDYFLKSNADASDLANWGTSANGTGNKPFSFFDDAQLFNVANGSSVTLSNNLVIGGKGSKIIVGDGVNSTNFIIPANYKVSGTVEVLKNSNLTIYNSTVPALGVLGDNSTVIYGANATQHIAGNVYDNLTINGSATKYLAANAEINGKLSMAGGHVDLGEHQLRFNEGSVLSGADSTRYFVTSGHGSLMQYIKGNNSSVTFPVGKANQYSPVTLKLTNSSENDNFSIRVADKLYTSYDSAYAPTGPEISTDVVQNTWFIDEEEEGGSSATITLEWRGNAETTTFNRNSLTIIHFDDVNGWETNAYAAASGTNPYTRTVSGFTDFSPFGVSGSYAPLPVEFISFTGVWKNKSAELKWETASEVNNSHFEVEKSEDVQYWEMIGTVSGNGTTEEKNQYVFTDDNQDNLRNPVLYYRLRQVDFNGNSDYSKTIVLKSSAPACNDVNTWHNSTEKVLNIINNCGNKNTADIILVNSFGNVVYHGKESLQNQLGIPTDNLMPGIYYLKIHDGFTSISRSVLIVH
ncbi:MAG: hypothetical protein ACXWEY_00310 [Bacteroidia bacterium]